MSNQSDFPGVFRFIQSDDAPSSCRLVDLFLAGKCLALPAARARVTSVASWGCKSPNRISLDYPAGLNEITAGPENAWRCFTAKNAWVPYGYFSAKKWSSVVIIVEWWQIQRVIFIVLFLSVFIHCRLCLPFLQSTARKLREVKRNTVDLHGWSLALDLAG